MEYREREKLKGIAHQLANSDSMEDQRKAVRLRAEAHFYRSEEAAELAGRSHPSFEVYFRHWLYADCGISQMQAAIVEWQKEIPKPESVRMAPGHTYWYRDLG